MTSQASGIAIVCALLAEKPKYRPTFYAVIVVATLAGVALNLLRIDVISALVRAQLLTNKSDHLSSVRLCGSYPGDHSSSGRASK